MNAQQTGSSDVVTWCFVRGRVVVVFSSNVFERGEFGVFVGFDVGDELFEMGNHVRESMEVGVEW